MPYLFGASTPVTTVITPSSASARRESMHLMRACGYGECRILPFSMPGTLRSSVYLPPPVVFSAASIMAVGLPIMEKSVIVIPSEARNLSSAGGMSSLDGNPLLLRRNRRLYRRIHLAVARTAAQIAAQGGTN